MTKGKGETWASKRPQREIDVLGLSLIQYSNGSTPRGKGHFFISQVITWGGRV